MTSSEKEREQKIIRFELELKVEFPPPYRHFLLEKGSAIIDGYKILGLATKAGEMSVLEATQQLRNKRPDLPKTLIAICLQKDGVMCLETGKTTDENCPLFDVSLNDDSILPMNKTFRQWMEIHQGYERKFKEAYERVQRRRQETEEWQKKSIRGKKRIFPKPKDWHPIISEIEDYTVGLTALRHNPHYNCLEVDEFYALDHPAYEPGGAIRNLVNIIFTFARDFSGTLNIIFTEERDDGKPSFFRPTRPLPQELISLAKHYKIKFNEAEEGKIHHEEGIKLWFALLEFPKKAREKVEELERVGYLTKEMIAEIITLGIWSREEVIWFLENASRPEAIILGTDLPESRILHGDSLNYGRSVLLTKRFQQVVQVQITDGFASEEREAPECLLEPKGAFWTLQSAVRFQLPWLIDKEEKVWIEQQEKILILSRPRIVSSQEDNEIWLKENIEFLQAEKKKAKIRIGCLIINYEMISKDFGQDPEKVKFLANEAKRQGIYIAVPYERCDQLDLEIESRIRRARKMRQFPARSIAILLQIIEIPKEEWDFRTLFGRVAQNAYDYGRLIANKVNITRYRDDFIITSGAVERMALGYSKAKKINKLVVSEKTFLEAFASEKGIGYSFVRPKDMPQFLKRLDESIFRDVQGGIVIIATPYKKIESYLMKIEVPTFFSLTPEKIQKRINQVIERGVKEKSYISHEEQIKSAHLQLQNALRDGLPLAVSHLSPQVFVETIREYLYYQSFLKKVPREDDYYEERLPEEPVSLRIVYNDGSEGGQFPLFTLRESFQTVGKFHNFSAQLVSLRHMLADLATECSIIRNIEIQRKEDSAEQEDFAFRKVYSFVETFLKLIKREIFIEEVEEKWLLFRLLWENAYTTETAIKNLDPQYGLRLHLFQSTGLEPAVVGAYRAVVALLQKYRGRLVVVPRIYQPTENLKSSFAKLSIFETKERQKIVSQMYRAAKEWY